MYTYWEGLHFFIKWRKTEVIYSEIKQVLGPRAKIRRNFFSKIWDAIHTDKSKLFDFITSPIYIREVLNI